MNIRARQVAGWILAGLGIAILLTELGRYWLINHPIHGWPVVIGSGIAFVGFYMLDPGSAKDAGGFLENATVRILTVIRSGRASTKVDVTAAPAAPVETHEDRPKLTDEDNGVG